ncbi:peptidase M24 [Microbacterium bovistercoris]|uniref:Peptidase M24 n=1 Tax=Microbacterium bovistercoris TaxID=2293570 RepID=A0A371NXN5_9MICO|nr:peptidase M24 [Microbacterium bovistercoris]
MLTSHEAISWYLEGVRTHVSLAGPPVLAVRAADDGDTLFVAANEADRLIAEELLPEEAGRIVRVPWQLPPAVAAAEAGGVAEADVAAPLRAARASLLPAERERYRMLGRETAEVLTDVLRDAQPAQSERALTGAVSGALAARGIDPLVVLVAGAGRVGYRHPLPTTAPLGERAMVVVCGRRHGLIANATRWVGRAGADDERVLAVERAFLDASVPGIRLNEAFAAGIAGYAAQGFDAEEWRRHHQGGPTGYAGRDPRATSDTDDGIVDGQAFAWNPTVPGGKVEDTMVCDGDGWEVLTLDERWPTVEHAGLRRPVAMPFR